MFRKNMYEIEEEFNIKMCRVVINVESFLKTELEIKFRPFIFLNLVVMINL